MDQSIISGFFKNFTFNEIAPPPNSENFQSGYYTSSMDILLQKSRRYKAVTENKIFDWIQIENDPNYARSNPLNKEQLERIATRLSLATQITTTVNSAITILGVKEFLPSNIIYLIENFQVFTDTNFNALNSVKQLATVKQIENAFFNDISFQYGQNNISFSDVAGVLAALSDNFPLQDKIRNNAIRPLLSLNLQSLFGRDIADFILSAQYIDKLSDVYEDSVALKQSLNTKVSTNLSTYAKDTKVSELVKNDEIYTQAYITLDDPMGLNLRERLISEIKPKIKKDVDKIILDVLNSDSNISGEDKEELLEIMSEGVLNTIDYTFRGQLGLPSLLICSQAISNESYNNTVISVRQAMDNFVREVIDSANINVDPMFKTKQKPFDYLMNIKTNIQKRLDMQRLGDRSEAFVQIDKFLSTVVRDKDLSDENLERLDKEIDKLLKVET